MDELMADNEKLKQKYTSHKRRLQRQHSAPHSSRLDDCRTSRPHPAMRPSSASRKSTAQFSLSSITEAPMDRHGAKNIGEWILLPLSVQLMLLGDHSACLSVIQSVCCQPVCSTCSYYTHLSLVSTCMKTRIVDCDCLVKIFSMFVL